MIAVHCTGIKLYAIFHRLRPRVKVKLRPKLPFKDPWEVAFGHNKTMTPEGKSCPSTTVDEPFLACLANSARRVGRYISCPSSPMPLTLINIGLLRVSGGFLPGLAKLAPQEASLPEARCYLNLSSIEWLLWLLRF